MCNCSRDGAEIALESSSLKKNDSIFNNHLQSPPSRENETEKLPGYTLIHCKPDDWKTIDFPNESYIDNDLKLSSSSSGSSRDLPQVYNIVNAWGTRCLCHVNENENPDDGDSNQKFDIIAERKFPREENTEKIIKNLDVECTLAIIKPDALEYQESIEKRIDKEGFAICSRRSLKLTPEQAFEFYQQEYGQIYFPLLVAYMTSEPIQVFVLAKRKAIHEWKSVIGPKNVREAQIYFPESLRAIFGKIDKDVQNALHGSSNPEQAQREIQFFFPGFVVEPLLSGDKLEDYFWNNVNRILIDGLALLCEAKPVDPILWLANWLLENNPVQPKFVNQKKFIGK